MNIFMMSAEVASKDSAQLISFPPKKTIFKVPFLNGKKLVNLDRFSSLFLIGPDRSMFLLVDENRPL